MNIYANKNWVEQNIYESKNWVEQNFSKTPSIATVGQTIIVKAVDDNGKPIEWEAVDRTHYTIHENKTVTFNGDITDKEYIEVNPENGIGYVKISDDTPDMERFIGQNISLYYQGDVQSAIITADKVTDAQPESGSAYVVCNYVIVVTEDATGNELSLSKGIWSIYEGGVFYVTSISYKYDTVVPLDKKYLPEDVILPTVSSDDNGKILTVVDGVWQAVTLPNAEEASF